MVCKTRFSKGVLALAVLTSMATVANAEQKSRDERIKAGEVYWSVGDEPPSMDPTKQVDQVSYFWLGHIYEGLMTYDKAGNIVPATAESYTLSSDKKAWTFKIRPTAKWQDGQPVKAKDFVFAFQRLVDPTFASEYSFIATAGAILNAEDIIAKKKPKEELGVRAVDDHTFEVKLSRPVAFFDSLMAFQAFFPVRQDIVEKFGPKFAAVPESIIGNGPFKLVAWQREQSMRIEKASTYWNAKAIKINAIESPSMVKDGQANFNNYQTGGLDFIKTESPEVIRQAQTAKLKIQSFPTGCVDFFQLNTRAGHPFADKDLRVAVEQGVNRSEFVNKIIGLPGYKAAYGLVPEYLPGSKVGSTFGKEAPLTWKDANTSASQASLKAYLATTKLMKVPAFTILAGDTDRAKKWAEYWQSALSKLLGAEVKIETVPFKTRLQKSRDGQYDLELAGWCPDYRDAMTFMDLYTTKNENNTTAWSNKSYDDLIEKAGNEPDLAARLKIFAEAQKILKAEAPIVPTDQTGGAYVVAPALKGFKRNTFGTDPDFRYAEWDSKSAPSH